MPAFVEPILTEEQTEFRFRKCFRDAFNQSVIAGGKALMHERGIAADEVDADGLCGAVQCLCKANGACTGVCARQHGDGRDGDALIHNRNAVLAADVLAGLDEVFGIAANFVVDLRAGLINIGIDAVEKRNAHRDGAHIEVLVIDHIYGFQNIMCIDHSFIPGLSVIDLDSVHGVENVLVHNMDLQAELFAKRIEFIGELADRHGRSTDVYDHDHGEHILQDGLCDFNDIDAFFCAYGGDFRENADHIFSDYGDDCFHKMTLPFPAKHKSALLWFSISLLSIKCGALSRFKRCFAGNSGVKIKKVRCGEIGRNFHIALQCGFRRKVAKLVLWVFQNDFYCVKINLCIVLSIQVEVL